MRGAAAQLVHKDQAPTCEVLEEVTRFPHLHEERRSIGFDGVAGSHPCEERGDNPEAGRARRDVGAYVGQDHELRLCLKQKLHS